MAEAWEHLGTDGKEMREEGNKEIREGKLRKEEIIKGAQREGDWVGEKGRDSAQANSLSLQWSMGNFPKGKAVGIN